MKYPFLTLAFAALAATGVPANTGLILLGDINFSSFSYTGDYDDDEDLLKDNSYRKTRNGFGIGLVPEFRINDDVRLSPGFFYETRGEYWKDRSGDGFFSYEFAYMVFPFMIKSIFPLRKVNIFAGFGPELSVIISADTVVTEGSMENKGSYKDDVTPLDVGIGITGGVEVPLGRYAAIIGIGFDKGFLNVDKVDEEHVKDISGGLTNKNIKILLGFKINLSQNRDERQ